jgi:hypothetical protein
MVTIVPIKIYRNGDDGDDWGMLQMTLFEKNMNGIMVILMDIDGY